MLENDHATPSDLDGPVRGDYMGKILEILDRQDGRPLLSIEAPLGFGKSGLMDRLGSAVEPWRPDARESRFCIRPKSGVLEGRHATELHEVLVSSERPDSGDQTVLIDDVDVFLSSEQSTIPVATRARALSRFVLSLPSDARVILATSLPPYDFFRRDDLSEVADLLAYRSVQVSLAPRSYRELSEIALNRWAREVSAAAMAGPEQESVWMFLPRPLRALIASESKGFPELLVRTLWESTAGHPGLVDGALRTTWRATAAARKVLGVGRGEYVPPIEAGRLLEATPFQVMEWSDVEKRSEDLSTLVFNEVRETRLGSTIDGVIDRLISTGGPAAEALCEASEAPDQASNILSRHDWSATSLLRREGLIIALENGEVEIPRFVATLVAGRRPPGRNGHITRRLLITADHLESLDVTGASLRLFQLLQADAPKPMSSQRLMAEMDYQNPRSLATAISRLRAELEERGLDQSMIRTVRGFGYALASRPAGSAAVSQL